MSGPEESTGEVSHSDDGHLRAAQRGFSGATDLRHRLLALVSLTLLAFGLLSVMVGLARSLPAVFAPVATAVLCGVAGWHFVRHRGPRRALWGAAGVLAAVGTVTLLVLLEVDHPLLVAGSVLVVAAAAVSGPALSWADRPRRRLVGRCRRPVLFVNPGSGGGTAERTGLVERAEARGIHVVLLDGEQDLADLAAEAVSGGADVLGVAGGDGTMAVVAAAAVRAGVPFVCVPAGTRNHFAMDVGLDREDPVAALDAFGPAVQRRVDLGWVGNRPFVNNVSIGLYGEAVAEEDYRDQPLVSALTASAELLGPEGAPLELRFEDGDGEHHEAAVVLHVSNNAHELGPGPAPTSRLRLDEGVLGVVAVVPGVVGGSAPSIVSWRCDEFDVDGDEPVAAGVDGEAAELAPPLEFRVAPGALAVRMPRGAAGISPAARRPPLTTRTVVRLVRVLTGRMPEVDPASSTLRPDQPQPPIA